MSIYAIRTVSTPRVMPPKEVRPLPKPTMSLAEDAARCNSRLASNTQGRTYSTTLPSRFPSTQDHAEVARIAKARAQRQITAQRILAALPSRLCDLQRAIGYGRNHLRLILRDLEAEGIVRPVGSKCVWTCVPRKPEA
jgi:hypothetical protein